MSVFVSHRYVLRVMIMLVRAEMNAPLMHSWRMTLFRLGSIPGGYPWYTTPSATRFPGQGVDEVECSSTENRARVH